MTRTRKPIILAFGLPGTGKSVGSYKLESSLTDYVRFNVDRVLTIQGIRDVDPEEMEDMLARFYRDIQKVVEKEHGIILESVYPSKKSRQRAYNLGVENDSPVLGIEFVCSEEAAISRLKKQNETGDNLHNETSYKRYKELWEPVKNDFSFWNNNEVSLMQYNSEVNTVLTLRVTRDIKPFVNRVKEIILNNK